jgi:lysozyme
MDRQTINLIKRLEGVKLKGYLDSAGLLTIGVGHLVKPGEPYKLGQSITLGECERLLAHDLTWARTAVERSVRVPINANQRSSLISLCFNIGETAFRRSTLLQKLNQGNYQAAAGAFMSWVYVKGKVIKGLQNRRAIERELFARK